MSTVNQLIDRSKHRPYRKCYIKRRVSDGTFESDWQRIDVKASNGQNRVITWGTCSIEIDSSPSEIGNFDVSSLVMVFDNSDGFFNVDTNSQSFWYGSYLNRKYTKLKVVVGYYDDDDSEVGEGTVFEGYIDKYSMNDGFTIRFTILSYQSILTRYNIYKLQEDDTIDGEMTVSQVVDTIMSQSEITNFIPYVASSPDVDATLVGTDENYLIGTYWDVLSSMAKVSNSVIYLVGDDFAFKSRTIGASAVHDFDGIGTTKPDIYSMKSYDDEGGESVRVWWQAESEALSVQSADADLLAKYLNQPQQLDLSLIKTEADKTSILNAYLTNWENPKPTIEFTTKFFINLINPLDKISITFDTYLDSGGLAFYWDDWQWDDGSLWSSYIGPFSITSGDDWMVTKVIKDIDNFYTTIKVEKKVI